MLCNLIGALRTAILSVCLLAGATMVSADPAAPLNVTADGVAMDGFDMVAYFETAAPAKGSTSFAVEHDGAQWLFSSQAHADAFVADPARYKPRNNGWCSYAVSEGYGAEVDFVNGWSIIDGALYLNWDQSTRDLFLADKDKRVAASDANWPAVSAGLRDGSVALYRHADDPAVGIQHPQHLP
jgi:YHS domain-containing protein